jgi:hypothetical protein
MAIWYFLQPICLFYGLCLFGTFFLFLVCFTKTNLASLVSLTPPKKFVGNSSIGYKNPFSVIFLTGVHIFHGQAIRVARWFGFKPKIPILVKFGGPCNGKCFNIF